MKINYKTSNETNLTKTEWRNYQLHNYRRDFGTSFSVTDERQKISEDIVDFSIHVEKHA